ncbi:MAG: CDP-alcohol phosphatidyltransferase family protein [Verrucomicrobiota bacterium]
MAKAFARLQMTPSAVTLLGGVFGIAAGHFYYYRDLRINIIGMALHVCANALDNADGQLARLTHQQSRKGRLFDGLIDYIIFVGIYLHLVFRILHGGGSSTVWILALAAGASHALQSATADYSRNAYLYFVRGTGEFDSYADLLSVYRELRWQSHPWQKLLLWLYLGSTREQELVAPSLHRLRQRIVKLPGAISPRFRSAYREQVLPTLRWWRFMMTNTRMLLLFVLLTLNYPIFYFWIELCALNLLLTWLLLRQEKISQSLALLLPSAPAEAA